MKTVVKSIWLGSSLEGDKKENKITLGKNTYKTSQIVQPPIKPYSRQVMLRGQGESSFSVCNVYFF